MSIPANPKRQPKMAAKKGGFLLRLDSVSDADREHLWVSLFPLIVELKQKARKNETAEK